MFERFPCPTFFSLTDVCMNKWCCCVRCTFRYAANHGGLIILYIYIYVCRFMCVYVCAYMQVLVYICGHCCKQYQLQSQYVVCIKAVQQCMVTHTQQPLDRINLKKNRTSKQILHANNKNNSNSNRASLCGSYILLVYLQQGPMQNMLNSVNVVQFTIVLTRLHLAFCQ